MSRWSVFALEQHVLMSDLKKPQAIVLCSSRFALPAIFFLQANKNLSAVFCCTRDAEFEGEIKQMQAQVRFDLVVSHKFNWLDKLHQLLSERNPDVVLVKTFPYKIPESLISIPKRAFLNFHYALLPQYRGAFPLFQVLKNRDEYGGLTVHHLTAEMDNGPMVFKQYVPIKGTDTYGDHLANLAHAGLLLTKQLMETLEDESVLLPSTPQNEAEVQVIAKPGIRDLLIDWNAMTAEQIVAMILASNYWSKGAITTHHSNPIHILFGRVLDEKHDNKIPGTILHFRVGESVKIACLDQSVIAIDTVFISSGYLPAFELYRCGITVGSLLGS